MSTWFGGFFVHAQWIKISQDIYLWGGTEVFCRFAFEDADHHDDQKDNENDSSYPNAIDRDTFQFVLWNHLF